MSSIVRRQSGTPHRMCHQLPAPHSKRHSGQGQEGQQEGARFGDRACLRTTGPSIAEVCFPEIVVGLDCGVTQIVLQHGVVGGVDNAVVVEVAARGINRQDAHRVPPCLIHSRGPVGYVVGVVVSVGPIGVFPPLRGCEI